MSIVRNFVIQILKYDKLNLTDLILTVEYFSYSVYLGLVYTTILACLGRASPV